MKLTKDNVREWAEAEAEKLLKPMFNKIDKVIASNGDEAAAEIQAIVVSTLVNRMVLDSLSVPEEDAMRVETDVILKQVEKKYNRVKAMLEEGIGEAFELGVSEAINRDKMFTCRITPVGAEKNALPC